MYPHCLALSCDTCSYEEKDVSNENGWILLMDLACQRIPCLMIINYFKI